MGKVIDITKKVLALGGLALGTSIGAIKANAADTRVPEALKMITDTAAEICKSVPLEQTASGTTLSADAQAKLGGLVGRIANLGLSGNAQYHSERSTGVLQKDLAAALQNTNNCKLTVFQTLERDLIRLNRPDKSSTGPSPDIIFWQSIVNSTNRADFEAYLQRFPNGQFASLAQNRVAALNQPIRRYSYAVDNPSIPRGGHPQRTVDVNVARYTDHCHAVISVRNPWDDMVATKVDVYALRHENPHASEDIHTISGVWQPGEMMSFSTDIPNYLFDEPGWDLAICIGDSSQCYSLGFSQGWKP